MGDATPEERALLAEAYRAGAQAWPAIGAALEEGDFAVYVAERARAQGSIAEALREMRTDDLFLACACARRIGPALAVFERAYLSRIPAFVARIDRSPPFADEVAQLVRLKLFVGDGEQGEGGKIASYTGRGPLDSWLCAVAVRTALSLVRARSDVRLPDEGADQVADGALGDDMELGFLRREYAPVFRDAVREAIASLPVERRNLLRFYFVDRLPLQQIGVMRGVHASTVMRWLRDVRAGLAQDVRGRLRVRFGFGAGELDSLERAVAGDIDLSLTDVLGAAAT